MEVFQEILNKHLGKAVGIILGLLYGFLAIKYGFFKAFFVLICAALGYYIGKRLDEKVDLRELFLRLFRER
ncbi:MAG TPA: hypothetical protein DCZ10_11835 [Pelotomaculum sp.]|nr:hypothetical protein [Pelotomaculum sp.]